MASLLGFFLKLLLSVLLPIMSMNEVSTCNYLKTAKNHAVANVAVAKREVVGSRGGGKFGVQVGTCKASEEEMDG